MAKKTTTKKPFSLFDSSAMGAGFNMAYAASLANKPIDTSVQNQNIVNTQKANLDAGAKAFGSYLISEKVEREEAEGEVKKRADKLINMNLGTAYYNEVSVFLDQLEKEYSKKDLGSKPGSKEARDWNQRYNKLMTSTQATQNALTTAATMVANNQHIKGGLSLDDSKFLIGVADLHLGETTDGIIASQNVDSEGNVSYTVTYFDKNDKKHTVTKKDYELKAITGTKKDVQAITDVDAIYADIIEASKNSKDKDFTDVQGTINKVEDVINNSDNPTAAYASLLTDKVGKGQTSFSDDLSNPESPLFEVILEELNKMPHMIKKYDKLPSDDGTENILDKNDFTGDMAKEVLKLHKEIKQNIDVGTKLYSAWFTATAAPEAFGIGKDNREKVITTDEETVTSMRTAKAFTQLMNSKQNVLPPITNVNGFTYKKTKLTDGLIAKLGMDKNDVRNAGGNGTSIYMIEYDAGTPSAYMQFYTPYEMTLLNEQAPSFTDLFTGPKGTINNFSITSKEYKK